MGFVAPPEHGFTLQNQGSDISDSDAVASGQTALISVAWNQDGEQVDAGILILWSSISGIVSLDANANGLRDSGEAGISGVWVHLFNASSVLVASTQTDANGEYTFLNVWVDGRMALS